MRGRGVTVGGVARGEVVGTGRGGPVGVAKGERQEAKVQRMAWTQPQPPASKGGVVLMSLSSLLLCLPTSYDITVPHESPSPMPPTSRCV